MYKDVIQSLPCLLHGRVATRHDLVRGHCDIKQHERIPVCYIQATRPRACTCVFHKTLSLMLFITYQCLLFKIKMATLTSIIKSPNIPTIRYFNIIHTCTMAGTTVGCALYCCGGCCCGGGAWPSNGCWYCAGGGAARSG